MSNFRFCPWCQRWVGTKVNISWILLIVLVFVFFPAALIYAIYSEFGRPRLCEICNMQTLEAGAPAPYPMPGVWPGMVAPQPSWVPPPAAPQVPRPQSVEKMCPQCQASFHVVTTGVPQRVHCPTCGMMGVV